MVGFFEIVAPGLGVGENVLHLVFDVALRMLRRVALGVGVVFGPLGRGRRNVKPVLAGLGTLGIAVIVVASLDVSGRLDYGVAQRLVAVGHLLFVFVYALISEIKRDTRQDEE